jgi:hypothetical protein
MQSQRFHTVKAPSHTYPSHKHFPDSPLKLQRSRPKSIGEQNKFTCSSRPAAESSSQEAGLAEVLFDPAMRYCGCDAR